MSTTTYNDIELDAFKKQSDIELIDIDKESAIKTNIYVLGQNFVSLKTYLLKIKALLIRQKLSFLISNTLNIGDNQTIIINGINYNIYRVNEFTVEITNLSNDWITDDLIIQIKNDLGVIQYLTITTINMKISINFIDGLVSNHNVYIL